MVPEFADALSSLDLQLTALGTADLKTALEAAADRPKGVLGGSAVANQSKLLSQIVVDLKVIDSAMRVHLRSSVGEIDALVPSPQLYWKVIKEAVKFCSASVKPRAEDVDSALKAFLPAATSQAVTMALTIAQNSGDKLSISAELSALLGAAEAAASAHEVLVRSMTGAAASLAPNLCAVVGPDVAGRLLAEAGGLSALCRHPAGSVQRLGKTQHSLVGMSSATVLQAGVLADTDVVANAEEPVKLRVARIVASKAILAARADLVTYSERGTAIDGVSADPVAAIGQALRREVEEAIERMLRPPPARTDRILPAPKMIREKKRGGRKARAAKAKYAISEASKLRNRVAFGGAGAVDGELEASTAVDMGMLTEAAASRLGSQPVKRLKMTKGAESKLATIDQKIASRALADPAAAFRDDPIVGATTASAGAGSTTTIAEICVPVVSSAAPAVDSTDRLYRRPKGDRTVT